MFISDFNLQGSGYLHVSVPLCKGLVEMGYEVYSIGINYEGQEHTFPFKIIPCKTFQEAQAMIVNLYDDKLEGINLVIVALDLPHQGFFLEGVVHQLSDLKYICITPLENPPLTLSWAAPLLNADGVFFISEIATQAAKKAGVSDAEHIQIGIEDNWRMPSDEERARIRKSFGVEDKFTVLTVADNQERKNLSAALAMVCMYAYDLSWEELLGVMFDDVDIHNYEKINIDIKYILITREHLTFGWKLRDLCTEYGINDEVMIVERGIPFDQLWAYYAASDLFLLVSKAEGLCLPVMEAQAVGVPVMATDTGAMPELLADGRGYLIPSSYTFRDVWGNGTRDMVDIEAGTKLLRELMKKDMSETVKKAKVFTDSRTWDVPVKQLVDRIKEITNE